MSTFMTNTSVSKLEGERGRQRVWTRSETASCVLDVCVFLAVHVQEAECWNPSTANYPNTINPNRCFTTLNAVT